MVSSSIVWDESGEGDFERSPQPRRSSSGRVCRGPRDPAPLYTGQHRTRQCLPLARGQRHHQSIKVNDKMEVLDKKDVVIPGLYAGRIVGGSVL